MQNIEVVKKSKPIELKNQRVVMLSIAAIKIGSRRRENLGRIAELAESIQRLGLLHPVVVDSEFNLVAGARRCLACQRLGWTEIPAQTYGDLTEEERREIELEENIRRKNLTPYELSKSISDRAETAGKILQKEFVPTASKNSTLGRPLQPDSEQRIAERINIPRQTINRARCHVEAVARYPELKAMTTQKKALALARRLDALSDQQRREARELIASGREALFTSRKSSPTPEEILRRLLDCAKSLAQLGPDFAPEVMQRVLSEFEPDRDALLGLFSALTQYYERSKPNTDSLKKVEKDQPDFSLNQLDLPI